MSAEFTVANQVAVKPGLCRCGCGGRTNLATQTRPEFGHVKGEPLRYIVGHRGRMRVSKRYRKTVVAPRQQRYEHIVKAERALGHSLPAGAEVHHINKNGNDNRNENLVVCQDSVYHQLLHTRQRALEVCGNPNWRKCCYCKQWDDVANLLIYATSSSARHRGCSNEYKRRRRSQ